MSFSCLPTELVRQIIESTIPSNFHSNTYTERQSTILSLCLVSRRFLPIARALLFEIVWIKSSEDVDLIISQSPLVKYRVTIQSLCLKLQYGPDPTKVALDRLADLCPSVSTLAICGVPLTSKLTLSENIAALRISSNHSILNNAPFPHLRSLTLYNNVSSILRHSLSKATLPSLEAFALVDANEECAKSLERSQFSELLPQLNMISLDLAVWSSLAHNLRQRIMNRTLVDSSAFSMSSALEDAEQLQHLRSYIVSDHIGSRKNSLSLADKLEQSAVLIEKKKPATLSTLFFDHCLNPEQDPAIELRPALERLVKACRGNDIEIVWEESPVDFEVDPVISLEFWRRQRERRRLERDQAK